MSDDVNALDRDAYLTHVRSDDPENDPQVEAAFERAAAARSHPPAPDADALLAQLHERYSDVQINSVGRRVTVRAWRFNGVDTEAIPPTSAPSLREALQKALEER